MSNQPSNLRLVERLRDNAQGINLGAEGMGWGPADLYATAADEIERLTAANAQLHAHDTEMWAEVKRLRAAILAIGKHVEWRDGPLAPNRRVRVKDGESADFLRAVADAGAALRPETEVPHGD